MEEDRRRWVELGEYLCVAHAKHFSMLEGADILHLSVTETSGVEVLATKNSDRYMVLMIVDHVVHAPTDNNGAGDPRTVIADVSALGAFSSATSLTIDKNTDPTNGPASVRITPAQKISVTLGGYGVTFVKLKP